MTERELVFSRAAYTIDAIQRAAYRFSDRLSIDLYVEDDLRCVLHLLAADDEAADLLCGEFRNEVLDQVLRKRIRAETEGIRNVVLAHAFSSTGLVSREE